MLKVVTLFSGYDSQCQALDRLGIDYELVAWSDIDKDAIAARNSIYPNQNNLNLGDVKNIDWSKVEDFDLMTYSSPCTDFSSSGLQMGGEEGSGTRSSLLWECKRAIEAKHPKYLIFENVKNLVSDTFIDTFNRWLDYLRTQGYETKWQVMNALDYNVPQNRERVIAVSSLDGLGDFSFPEPMIRTKTINDILEYDLPDSSYFSDEKARQCIANSNLNLSSGNSCAILEDFYQGRPVRVYKEYAPTLRAERSGLKVVEYNIGALRGRNPENPSERARSNGMYAQRFEVDSKDFTNTLTTVAKDNVVMETSDSGIRLRYLTARECFRLMDVDESNIDKIFSSGIGKTSMQKIAGNSICVNVLTEVFRQLLDKSKRVQVALF